VSLGLVPLETINDGKDGHDAVLTLFDKALKD